MKNIKCGFSLIELLISLIIISLIAAVFVPVMTKKLKNDRIALKGKETSKGVQIFSNPGNYSFDVPNGVNKIYISAAAGGGGGGGARKVTLSKTFTTNQTWSIPKGVSEIRIKITGAGGGGGGAYAYYPHKPCALGYAEFQGYADNGQDLCIGIPKHLSYNVVNLGDYTEQSLGPSVCWRPVSGAYNYLLCTFYGAIYTCRDDRAGTHFTEDAKSAAGNVRLIAKSEMKRIIDQNKTGSSGLNMCGQVSSIYPSCPTLNKLCMSAQTFQCAPYAMYGQKDLSDDADFFSVFIDSNKLYTSVTDGSLPAQYFPGASPSAATQVRCAYIKNDWQQYSGAGGNSGGVLEKTLSDVSSGDVLNIKIGAGGNGGSAGNNGSDGGDTSVSIKGNTYLVKGAKGGAKATSSANGSQSAPLRLCYLNSNIITDMDCEFSLKGESGENLKGGNGAIVKDSEELAAQGGELTSDFIMGDSSSSGEDAPAYAYGFGGGGGTCKRGVRTPLSCSKGGKGSKGKIEVFYDVIYPAGGGGAGASAGVNAAGVSQEIEYEVTPGEHIILEIGKGGEGGDAGVDGIDGCKTTIAKNHIVLNPGKAGKASGSGGSGGTLSIGTSRAKFLNVQGVTNPGKGSNGNNYRTLTTASEGDGLDGGKGGSTFLGYFGGCGGGMFKDNCSYVNIINGQDAKYYNAVNNSQGGAGGGGGGGKKDGTPTPGKGGSGSDGFVRIRWGAE